MKKILISALILGGLLNAASAVEFGVTSPVGYEKIPLAPNVFNVIGQRLQLKAVQSGAIEAITATTVTDNDYAFQANLVAGKVYALEITSGDYTGLVFEATAGTGNTLNVGNDLTAAVSAGTTYTLRPAITLEELFGTTNTVLKKGLNISVADAVHVPDGNGGYTRYFVYSLTGAWKRSDGVLAPNVPLIYTDGILVEKRADAATLIVKGEVKPTSSAVTIINGFNVISTIFPVGATLQNIGLEDDLQNGLSIGLADVIWIPDGLGNYKKYYLNFSGDWCNFDGSQVASDIPLTPGVFLERRGGTTTVDLTPPSHYSGL